MEESKLTRKVMHVLDHYPNGVVFKHADRFSAGVPDISMTAYDRTLWLELKSIEPEENLTNRVSEDMLQLHTMARLAEFGNNAFYMIEHLENNRISFWHPEVLYKRVLGQDFSKIWFHQIYDAPSVAEFGEVLRSKAGVTYKNPMSAMLYLVDGRV